MSVTSSKVEKFLIYYWKLQIHRNKFYHYMTYIYMASICTCTHIFWYQQMLNTRSKVQVLEDLDAFKHFIIIHNNTIKQNFLEKWSDMSYLNSVSSTFNLKQNGTHIHKPFIYSFYFFTAVRISNVMGITKYTIM